MITYTALTRFTETRLNAMCLNFERAYSNPSEVAIHDLRVSIRRLLTHLDYLNFLLDRKKNASKILEAQHNKIKRYLKSLNRIRDLQNQIHALENSPIGREYPLKLLEILKTNEKSRLSTLADKMDRWTLQKTRKILRSLIHSSPISNRELVLKSHLYLNFLTQELHSAVHECQKADLMGCHRLRIRLKHYRYHLEMLEQGFEIKQILISAVKDWQDELGALQDLRVLLEQIDKADSDSDPQIQSYKSTIQSELDDLLNKVKDEVYVIRFETQLK